MYWKIREGKKRAARRLKHRYERALKAMKRRGHLDILGHPAQYYPLPWNWFMENGCYVLRDTDGRDVEEAAYSGLDNAPHRYRVKKAA